MKHIEIVLGSAKAEAELLEECPKISQAIWDALPLKGPVNHAKISNEELMYMIPLILMPENEVTETPPGTLAYWPTRQVLCIFYGKAVPAAPVSKFGRVTKNLEDLQREARKVWKRQGAVLEIRQVE